MPRTICFVMSMYRDAPRVRAFVDRLRCLTRPPGVDLQILVTDNGCAPRIPRIRGAEVLAAPRNLGYLGGCVHAFERWRARGGEVPEWVCITNTDLVLGDDFLVRLAEEPWPDDAGVAAPDIRLVNGAPQNPLLWRRPSRIMMLAYALLARSRLFAVAFNGGARLRHDLRRVLRGNSRAPENASIYAPHGSIMALHRRFFARGASLRYAGVMYGEEIHIAEQARRTGLRVVWRRDLHVVHDEHATIRLVSAEQRHRWLAESASVLWRDYFASES